MSTTLFYHPEAAPSRSVEFDSSEATHIAKALRMKAGDRVEVTNGAGQLFVAELRIDKHRVSAEIVHATAGSDFSVPLEIAIAPTKNADRIEWMVEKAVELGVGTISLLNCDHSERTRVSLDRIQRVAIAALKQSRRTYLPKIQDTVDFRTWLTRVDSHQRFIAHCIEQLPRTLLRDAIGVNRTHTHGVNSVSIAIGPEGDFSESEVVAAQSVSFQGVSLGDARLRTETAALAAVHTYNLLHQKSEL
jgi:16S rRNA (uracil1498-N3)-methyltransferase